MDANADAKQYFAKGPGVFAERKPKYMYLSMESGIVKCIAR